MSKGTGRPTKFTEQTVNRILEAIRNGLSYRHAVQAAGISYDTFLRWMEKGENARSGKFREFFDQVKKAEAEGAERNMKLIQEAAETKDWKAAAWILERRHPDDYGEKRKVDANLNHSGEVNIYIPNNDRD